MASRPAGGEGVRANALQAPPATPVANGRARDAFADAPTGADVALEPDGELSAQRDAPVGGQAVLEGVMMRGVSNWAVAVRKPSDRQLREEPHR